MTTFIGSAITKKKVIKNEENFKPRKFPQFKTNFHVAATFISHYKSIAGSNKQKLFRRKNNWRMSSGKWEIGEGDDWISLECKLEKHSKTKCKRYWISDVFALQLAQEKLTLKHPENASFLHYDGDKKRRLSEGKSSTIVVTRIKNNKRKSRKLNRNKFSIFFLCSLSERKLFVIWFPDGWKIFLLLLAFISLSALNLSFCCAIALRENYFMEATKISLKSQTFHARF